MQIYYIFLIQPPCAGKNEKKVRNHPYCIGQKATPNCARPIAETDGGGERPLAFAPACRMSSRGMAWGLLPKVVSLGQCGGLVFRFRPQSRHFLYSVAGSLMYHAFSDHLFSSQFFDA